MAGSAPLDIPNAGAPAENIYTGGRPQPEHFQQAKERGVRTVINLCPPAEPCAYDEAALVDSLGLRYINIPIAGVGDLNRENAQRLADSLATSASGGVLVHCASSNRVGALFALKAHYIDGADVEQALATGRAAGLKAMEPAVRSLLGA